MKTQSKSTEPAPLNTVSMLLSGGKAIDIRFSDLKDAKDAYDILKNHMVFQGMPVKTIELRNL